MVTKSTYAPLLKRTAWGKPRMLWDPKGMIMLSRALPFEFEAKLSLCCAKPCFVVHRPANESPGLTILCRYSCHFVVRGPAPSIDGERPHIDDPLDT